MSIVNISNNTNNVFKPAISGNHIVYNSGNTASVSMVFIDSGVEDLESLVKGVVKDAQVVVLDTSRDGVEQIAEVLAAQNNVVTVHIVSHGAPGCLYLGNSQLSLDTLEQYAPQLQPWFSTGKYLLLYGCNVAAGDAGAEFIQKLHQLTGAEIAASAQRTGSARKGGNWELEVRTGDFVPSLAFLPQMMATYAGVLSEPNDIIAQAISTGFNGSGTFSASGVIGDNPNISSGDVDLYQVQLNAGTFITVNVNAKNIGSGLDSYLRLFDASGTQVVRDDDSGPNSDSFFSIAVPTTGTYYLGVSGFGNNNYDPLVQSGSGGSTGNYNINIAITPFFGPSASLATAPGDGGVRVTLDAFGSFGSSVGNFVSNAFYDPVGSLVERGTVYESGVAIRFGDTGSRAFLTSGEIAGPAGPSIPTFSSVSPSSLQSSFTYNGLNFSLDQRVSDLFEPLNLSVRTGSQLTQTYTITNPGSTAVNFELIRYVDGDLGFDGNIGDTGGVRIDPDGKTVLFELDSGSNPSDRTTFVGITAVGGNALPGSYEIDSFAGLRSRIADGTALDNIITDDTNGDNFIDTSYDVTLGLARGFLLNPGQTATYTTSTIFGEGVPLTFPINIAPIATTDTATTPVNTAVTINVLANDSDADGGSLSLSSVTNPTNGTVAINNNGTPGNLTDDFVTYTPNTGFSGTDSFTYQISDGQGGTATGAVSVTVELPTVNITALDATAAETGGDTGTYRISRNSSSGSLSVGFALSGNATPSDYTLSNNISVSGSTATVVFADGQSFVDVVLNPVNDTIAELEETLTLSLNANAAYNLGSNTTTTVTIAASDQITGTAGNDRLIATPNDDIIFGLDGNDNIAALEGNDLVFGGNGNDIIDGDEGNDTLYGGAGNDRVEGSDGNDLIFGDAGIDTITGDRGNDTIRGGLNNDFLTGGTGSDIFVLAVGEGTDVISDFRVGQSDKIGLAGGLTFNDLSFSGNQISVGSQILASLVEINTANLTAANFISV